MTKTCIYCKLNKDITCFAKNTQTKDRRRKDCKLCYNERHNIPHPRPLKIYTFAESKICPSCNTQKKSAQYIKNEGSQDGLYFYCNDCCLAILKANCQNNEIDFSTFSLPEKLTKKDKAKNDFRHYMKNNPNRKKLWRERAHIKERRKAQLKLSGMQSTYRKRCHEKHISSKIASNIRSRMGSALARFKIQKHTNSKELTGCTWEFLKLHLESNFKEGMTWENYGRMGWHIDHIIPCKSFDLTIPENQEKCFHYTNLQPLWWQDNIKKNFI